MVVRLEVVKSSAAALDSRTAPRAPCSNAAVAHLSRMRKRKSVSASLPFVMAELMLASWETIARRSLMMASGSCSAAEYRRMIDEKALAAYRSGLMLARSRRYGVLAAMLVPWHKAASANARRLRRR